jgi:molybdenum cofactor synthesis domain-containing protein
MTTVAAIVIGDELLSGKVHDVNARLLVDTLRERGVTLGRLVVIPDRLEAIADEIRRCSVAFDTVITSGGIGPTHDDLTVAAVGRAFDLEVVRHGELGTMVRRFWGERVNAAALRMADVPAGARLLGGGEELLPTIVVRNLYLLPGVPELFAAKLPAVVAELEGHRPTLVSLHLHCDETSVADLLARVAAATPGVAIGSYPSLEAGARRHWVTVEGLDAEVVRGAVDCLLAVLPGDAVARVDRSR